MPVDIDMAAIFVMESFGLVSFLATLLFFKQRQRMSDKQRALSDAYKNGVIGEKGDGKCYSSEWILANIVYKRRKMLDASPLLAVAVGTMTVLLYFEIGPRAFSALLSLGYVTIVALVGFAILTETDAFEAYSYSKAVYKVSIKQFDKADQSYMDIALDALRMATMRFLMIGIFFAVLGPFIPQIFSSVLNTLLFYTSILFNATGALSEVSQGLALLIAFILPGLMLFVPLVLGKTIFLKAKMLAQKMLKRSREE